MVANSKSDLGPLGNTAAHGLSVALLPQDRHIVCLQAQGVLLEETSEWVL